MTAVAPYGSWPSPLTPAAMGAIGSGGIGQVEVDGTDVLWAEARPADGGRTTIMRRAADGAIADLLHAPFDVGSRVHEYGGRAFAVADGTVWFSHRGDDRVYRLAPGSEPQPSRLPAARGWPTSAWTPGADCCSAWPRITVSRARRATTSSPCRPSPGRRRDHRRLRLLRCAAAEPRRQPGWPGSAGQHRTCPGTPPSCGSPASARTAPSPAPCRSRVARTNRSSHRAVPGRCPALRQRSQRILDPLRLVRR